MRHLRLPRSVTQPGSLEINPADMTAATVAAEYGRGDYRPSDVVGACLDRIRRFEPLLNAFIVVNHHMLEDAARADAEIERVRHVRPRALVSALTRPRNTARSCGSSCPIGSSNRCSSASRARARASEARCC